MIEPVLLRQNMNTLSFIGKQALNKEASMISQRILFLEHLSADPPGSLGEMLQEQRIAYDVVHVPQELPSSLDGYAALIALGGPEYAGDETILYLVQERALIRSAIELDIPYLGICLGGQLLAYACGAQVHRANAFEIGFADVALTDEAMRDPLFEGFSGRTQRVFNWHNDSFDLPPGAVLLETGDPVYHQAFRYGRRAYGLQHHIELTPGMLRIWLRDHPEKQKAVALLGEERYEGLGDEDAQGFSVYAAHSRMLFTNFLRISSLLPEK
jgi:GMP synthase (glutamine-hydrolysing)